MSDGQQVGGARGRASSRAVSPDDLAVQYDLAVEVGTLTGNFEEMPLATASTSYTCQPTGRLAAIPPTLSRCET
jgi:hypothetical protein